jgi:23S rRNA (cytosine1962-C5)-methyltransferase
MKQKPRGKPDKGPKKRNPTARIPTDVARRVRDGHPLIFNEALRGRVLPPTPGHALDVVDADGRFVARAVIEASDNLALRVFSRIEGQDLDRAYLQQRVEGCMRLRQQLLDLSPTSCYRLINGDSEGIPAISVDAYGPYLVACCYSAAAQRYLDDLIKVLEELGGFAGLYLQRRFQAATPDRPRPGAELCWGEAAPPEVTVNEGGVQFVVDVSSPASPGLYPDMRLGRQAVGRLAGGRRVLNCFSYTGAFSAVAAVHGAHSVVSVDASSRAHGRARRNFAENGLDHGDPAFTFITGDTFAALARMAERNQRFDLVVLDPPTFSSSKGRTFTALRDYGELVAAALGVLDPGGILCASSNAAKLSPSDFDRALGRGAALSGQPLIVTQRLGQPPDYPVLPGFSEGAYLKLLIASTP